MTFLVWEPHYTQESKSRASTPDERGTGSAWEAAVSEAGTGASREGDRRGANDHQRNQESLEAIRGKNGLVYSDIPRITRALKKMNE